MEYLVIQMIFFWLYLAIYVTFPLLVGLACKRFLPLDGHWVQVLEGPFTFLVVCLFLLAVFHTKLAADSYVEGRVRRSDALREGQSDRVATGLYRLWEAHWVSVSILRAPLRVLPVIGKWLSGDQAGQQDVSKGGPPSAR